MQLLPLLAALIALATSSLQAGISVQDLRCEYLENPLAIDRVEPRLSWSLSATERAQHQTAYQVLVARSRAALERNAGNLWDSGKVPSAEQNHIRYRGTTLIAKQSCYWKVRVWDAHGHPSPWSAPAHWSVGLLAPEDWKARWIAAPTASRVELADCFWIWFPEGEPAKAAPTQTRYFRKSFIAPPGPRRQKARLLIAADNTYRVFVNGRAVGQGEGWQQADLLEFEVSPGTNLLAIEAANTSTAPNPAGLLARLLLSQDQRETEALRTDGSWKTSREASAGWTALDFDDAGWLPARELGKTGMAPWGKVHARTMTALPLFRREFNLDQSVQRALVHVCGLGQYELRLNGHKVGDREMDPGWTDYRKRCQYSTYDLTSSLRSGTNVLGVWLGNGMYNVEGGRYVKFTGSFGPPKVILQLELEFADGTTATLGTDAAWQTAPGPIAFSCIYGGEDYDGRRERAGWDAPGFSAAEWQPAQVVDGPGGRLVPQLAPPVQVMNTCDPVRITEPKPGTYVYDLGQNFSGWPVLEVEGSAGSTVQLIPGELLDQRGLVSQRSSGGPVSFSYTLKGAGSESWHPRFSYYGFRYVQVEGATRSSADSADRPRLRKLQGQFLYASARRVGRFSCSDPLINRIHDLIDRAIESNFHSVLTDCPHREKLGWLEVSHLLAPAILYNFDAAQFYRKIVADMADAQTPDGLVPDIAPEYTVFNGGFRDSPEWGSAYVINPWHLHHFYGDTTLFAEHFEGMKRYAAYLGRKARAGIVSHGLGDWYDIGPNPPGESQLTSKGVTATAIYFHDLQLLEKAAELLGKNTDAAQLAQEARRVSQAFNREYFRADTSGYDRNSQTANAMALTLGLAPTELRAPVLENLVRNIEAARFRVTAGDVGFVYLVRALSDAGHGDLLYRMVTQTNGPGYAEQLARGATSLTEAWDANPHSSHNHCMLGHAEEWFYRGLGGIVPDPQAPGFRQFSLRPQLPAGLAAVQASYDSVRGPIRSEWQRVGRGRIFRFTVPVNSEATVVLSQAEPAQVREGGQPLTNRGGIHDVRAEQGNLVMRLGSGQYEFECADR